jgi:hypothetical protein
VGETPSSLLTTYTKNGLTTGVIYSFRYRLKNKFGWSPFSDTDSFRAATLPSAPSAPLVSVVSNTNVRVIWSKPYNGGDSISAYSILFKHSGGSMIAINSYCDGTSLTIVNNRYCDIPFTILRSALNTNLALDALVQAQVAAVNVIGQGSYSSLNTIGATI